MVSGGGGHAGTTAGSTGGAGTTGASGVAGTGGTSGVAGTGGTSGVAGTTGSGGSSGAAGNFNRDGGMYDAYAERPPGAPGVLIHVVNGCSFDLYLHSEGKGATLTPDGAKLAANGGSQDYTAPDNWSAGRVTAYSDSALKNELDKVELTIVNKDINYNITYVDWVGLPVEMIAFGKGTDCKRAGCYVKQSDLVATCPEKLLKGKQCVSAYHFCEPTANAADPLCHALDGQFAKCAAAGCPMATTKEVYGCNGPYGNQPKWCAALNRGRPMNPDDPDASLYYTSAPYNIYAKWVHDTCPSIYAFPYDDYGKSNQSSFHDCTGGTQLDVTFCPNG